MTVDGIHMKSRLGFFDEIFHSTAFAVKVDKIFRQTVHVCNNKCIQKGHLICGFFHFAYDPSRIQPGICFIHEFTITHGMIHQIVSGLFQKFLRDPTGSLTEFFTLFHADDIRNTIGFLHTEGYRQNHYHLSDKGKSQDNHQGIPEEEVSGMQMHLWKYRCFPDGVLLLKDHRSCRHMPEMDDIHDRGNVL